VTPDTPLPTPTLPPAAEPAGNAPPPRNAGRREFWLIWLASWLLRMLTATLRFEVEGPELLQAANARQTAIFVFWHNRLLLVPQIWHRYLAAGRLEGKAMTSTSGDGELIAQFLRRFHVGPVRGSATRRGTAALRELLGWLKRGHDVCITPDGSRGPIYELKPGVVTLAQLSGVPLLAIGIDYSRAWRLKGWDRFFIPQPFSKVTVRLGPLHPVQRTTNAEEFEVERLRCQDMMMSVVRER
jgi:lysophospholipid acyltransferase (LPLAT)-like uncharacterized protein